MPEGLSNEEIIDLLQLLVTLRNYLANDVHNETAVDDEHLAMSLQSRLIVLLK